MLSAISTALSGLTAASKRVETASENIANLSSAGALNPADGPLPYETQLTVQKTSETGGALAESIPKNPGFIESYAPDSPFANEDGLIGVPNTNLAEEAVNMKLAEITYKANLKTLETTSDMTEELFRTLDRKA